MEQLGGGSALRAHCLRHRVKSLATTTLARETFAPAAQRPDHPQPSLPTPNHATYYLRVSTYLDFETYTAFTNTSGCCSAIRNNDLAGPLGLRLPRSHSCTMRRFTPINPAKADYDKSSRSRISRDVDGLLSSRVLSSNWPVLWALISRTPSRISFPIFRSDIFDFLGYLFQNVTRYALSFTLTIDRQHPDFILLPFPIIDDPDTATFAFAR